VFDLHFKRARNVHHGLWALFKAPVIWEALKDRARHLYHWSYVRHYLNYLIVPSVLYWSVVVMLFINPFAELFKDGLIIVSTVALSVIYWHLKEVFSHERELHYLGLRALSLVKIFTALLAYTALTAVGWYFGIALNFIAPVVYIATVLLVYQSLLQHKLLVSRSFVLIAVMGLIITMAFAVVFQFWSVNYYTAGLMIAVVYTCCWSLLRHYLEKTLSLALAWEYVFMFVVLLSIILATHDFQGRILMQ
jgi:hypothetical protein